MKKCVSFSKRWLSTSGMLFIVFLQIFQNFLLLFYLSRVVFCLFISDFDFEFVVLQLFLLSLNFNTKVKKLFFETWLILFEIWVLGLLRYEALLNLYWSWENFIDKFLTLLSEHFKLNFLFLFSLNLFEETIVNFFEIFNWIELWRSYLRLIHKVLTVFKEYKNYYLDY
mgnify:FL=1